jgi:pimeloyl-ACP methyl ester carboxylesterase
VGRIFDLPVENRPRLPQVWMMLKWLLAAVIVYGGFVALLYVAQRSLQYFPERQRTAPWGAGLPEAEEAVLDTADGERVIVWHVPSREGQPIFLYFHGNGGSLRWREERFHALIADGSGLVALSYRGYGGSSGRPTETGLVEDAAAAYAFAVARYPAERIVLWGESLGSALALALAAEKPGTSCSRPPSPRLPMLARGITGSYRCGSS